MTKIGCIALVPWEGGGFVGINCAKGRGLILPGGKYDVADGTYEATASRELHEETGVFCRPEGMKYLFQGPSITDDYWVIAFLGDMGVGPLMESQEGKPQRVIKAQLMTSRFKAYYSLLFNALRDRNLHRECIQYAGT
jgi:8-oxo-dGTP pyrophosphatase MutT (NUDIX family)